MKPILIVYSSTEGQTARIAEHLAGELRRQGSVVEVHETPELGDDVDLHRYAGVVLGASLHMRRHQKAMEAFARRHRDALAALPNAFFSVSLSAKKQDEPETRAALEEILADFVERTGWRPDHVMFVAGALKYSHYGFVKRAVMRSIARKEGGDTDTSQDYDYTDWPSVDRFAENLVRWFHGEAGTTDPATP